MAKRQDIPALCEMWKACFSDSEEYIKRFYRENFEHIDVVVLTVDGEPACMAHMFDATVKHGDISVKAKYLYAGGTHPKHRNKGYFIKMQDYITDLADKKGTALIFQPATSELTDFYKALGFETDSSIRRLSVIPKARQPLDYSELSYQEYNRLRNDAFSDIPYVKWPDRYLKWCIEENALFSGKALGIKLDGKDCFLMGFPEGKTLIINETNLTDLQLKKISGALCKIFSTEKIYAYYSKNAGYEGETLLPSCVYNTPVHNIYLNLTLL